MNQKGDDTDWATENDPVKIIRRKYVFLKALETSAGSMIKVMNRQASEFFDR